MRLLIGSALMLAFAFSLANSAFAAPAHAEELNLKTPKDWDALFAACESNWEQYDNDLNRLRTSIKRECDSMDEKQYMDRWQANDPMIRFVRIHWPAIFSGKDAGWGFYSNCADKNWEVRKSLNSATDTKAEKKKKIENLKICIASIFSRDTNVPFPFDRLIACYGKHAR